MLLRTRWRKILRDLGVHKARVMLVVLSIALGVFAVGAITGSQIVLARNLESSYRSINPAHATIITVDTFGDDLVKSVRGMRSVEEAEARRAVNVRLQVGPEEWRSLRLVGIPDFEDIDIDKVRPEQGAWPPPDETMLIERSALGLTQAEVGDVVRVKTPDGDVRKMRISGLAHDLYARVYVLDGMAYGFINFDTLEWLGEPRNYNELRIRVASQPNNKAHIKEVANEVQDKVEESGRTVLFRLVPDPGQHPLNYLIQAVSLILGALSILALLLSGFLVVNVISAILAQEIQQIGIMKAVGGRTGQIARLYLVMVLIFGFLALFIALPLGAAGAFYFTKYMSRFFNFDVTNFQIPSLVIALEVGVALLVPAIAGFFPILSGTRITVHQAISSYGLGKGQFGTSAIDRWLSAGSLSQGFWQFVSRPVMLSLRNTVRRKKRLILTLTTLTLAGAIFIGVFSVYASLQSTLDRWLRYFQYDLAVMLQHPYRVEGLKQEALRVPGVTDAESWGFYTTRRVRPDGSHSGNIILLAPPADTQLINPRLVEGRWLRPGDERGVVLNTITLRDESDLAVGDEITLKIQGDEINWTVIGLVEGGSITATAFMNYNAFARAAHDVGEAQWLAIVTEHHTRAYRDEVSQALESHFDHVGLNIDMVTTVDDERADMQAIFQAIVALLLIMAVLLAVVGGLGLAGTMSINVLERRREIGVMRSIGASDRTILAIILVEGSVIGLISWLVGGLMAIPLSSLLSYSVGRAFLRTALNYDFSILGAAVWLLLVIVLAVLSSFLPARRASQVTVREVLAYE